MQTRNRQELGTEPNCDRNIVKKVKKQIFQTAGGYLRDTFWKKRNTRRKYGEL